MIGACVSSIISIKSFVRISIHSRSWGRLTAIYKICGGTSPKGGVFIFKRILGNKKQNTQPENARIAHRAVKLAQLAEINNVSLSFDDASGLAGVIAEITDRELEDLSAGASPIVGCPAKIIPLFAGYSGACAACPYFVRDPDKKQSGCVLKED